jgi:hypothetical protein
VLDVVTAKQELSMPPTITPEEVRGFNLWAGHTDGLGADIFIDERKQ